MFNIDPSAANTARFSANRGLFICGVATLGFAGGGCGGVTQGGSGSSVADVQRVRMESQHIDYDITFFPQPPSTVTTVLPSTVERVWEVLRLVYRQMPIPIQRLTPASHVVGGSFGVHGRFHGKALSKFVNCGFSVMGANADMYNVQIRVSSNVDTTADGRTQLRTMLSSSAASNGGTTVPCSSFGTMEKLIADSVMSAVSPKTAPHF